MHSEVIKLENLAIEQMPVDLQSESYFDFNLYLFEHQTLFENSSSVIDVLNKISVYCKSWINTTITQKKTEGICKKEIVSKTVHRYGNFVVFLEEGALFEPARIIGSSSEEIKMIYLEKNARVLGSEIYLDSGSIYIGKQASIEPGVVLKGPIIIGDKTKVLHGAYLRGNCLIGNECVLRGELKNVIIMNKGSFPHPSYLGDSICGYHTHFGNQATTANLGIYEGIRDSENFKSLIIECDGIPYDIGRSKMGICMGDFCQIGCNSVSDPCTFLKPYTIAYAQIRIPKGIYGPREVLKSNLLKQQLLSRSALKPL